MLLKESLLYNDGWMDEQENEEAVLTVRDKAGEEWAQAPGHNASCSSYESCKFP